jgi:hypothetical protein
MFTQQQRGLDAINSAVQLYWDIENNKPLYLKIKPEKQGAG